MRLLRALAYWWRQRKERKAAERKLRMLTAINLEWNGLHDADA